MKYRLSNEELACLHDLIGKEVCTGGGCIAQDEFSVTHHCSMPEYKGILRKVNYDKNTKELSSIVLECDSRMEKIDFDPTPEGDVRDIEKGMYRNNRLILKVSSKT